MRILFKAEYIKFFIIGILFVVPIKVDALDIFDLDSNYYTSDFFTIPFDSTAIAFDSDNNLYTVNKYDFRTTDPENTITIYKFHASTGYSTFEPFLEYTGRGVSGLEFDCLGNLYVAEVGRKDGFLDIGRIDKIDTSFNVQTIANFTDFRPTGIALGPDGKIYFPGRRDSDLEFGNIYKLDPLTGNYDIFLEGYVGTAIAIDVAGNIFFSTTSIPVVGQDIRTTYKFNPKCNSLDIFATTFPTVEELTFDFKRQNLFVLEVTEFDPNELHPPEIKTISPKVTIDSILNFFDKSVEDGTLEGAGEGWRSKLRLCIMRMMLVSAAKFIDSGQINYACCILNRAHSRCDGDDWPLPDFVVGDAVSELSDMILNLLEIFGCNCSQ